MLLNRFAHSLVLSWVALTASALAQSTAFTYQGRLSDDGAPTDGLHDMQFRLFDLPAGGTQVGSTLCANDVDMVGGHFTVQLDFGQQFATSAGRHREIHVRQDTGQPCTEDLGCVLLSPRQQLTATPLASHARSAFALDAPDGSPTNAVFVDNAGSVGIGTNAPQTELHVYGDAATLRLQDDDNAASFSILEDWQPGILRLMKFNALPSTTLIDLDPMPLHRASGTVIRASADLCFIAVGPR